MIVDSDLALADAVAAADFRIIRQCCNGLQRVRGDASLERLAEDQRVAHLRDVGRLLLEIVEPGAVAGLAEQHGADDLVVLQDHPLVDAGGGVAQDDLLAVVAIGEVADANRGRCR